jgi:hypothetical protein
MIKYAGVEFASRVGFAITTILKKNEGGASEKL